MPSITAWRAWVKAASSYLTIASAKVIKRLPYSTPLLVAAVWSVKADRFTSMPLCSLLARSRYEWALVQ
jgi:hypothetical protein